MKLKLDHCVIHVSNWERANSFYENVLGAELIPVGSGWSYRFGQQQLNIHAYVDALGRYSRVREALRSNHACPLQLRPPTKSNRSR
ncbi:MAG: hypothetical protein H0X31_22010 [Nostocaceae cyanobacterium]|nr:hypothetical protein [Nostocaceae cyanobacterium]